jgi:hypothetical protein
MLPAVEDSYLAAVIWLSYRIEGRASTITKNTFYLSPHPSLLGLARSFEKLGDC